MIKRLIIFTILVLIYASIPALIAADDKSTKEAPSKVKIQNITESLCKKYLEDHIDDFDKQYSNEKEFREKLKNFCDNLKKINKKNKEYNQRKVAYTVDSNKFTDINYKKFKAQYTPEINDAFSKEIEEIIKSYQNESLHHEKRQLINEDFDIKEKWNGSNLKIEDIPNYINWVEQGKFNEVTEQYCGSCWAHTTTALVEHYYEKLYKTLPKLSEQNLVDCISEITQRDGCDGANALAGMVYIKHKGISNAADYPNTLSSSKCRQDVPKSDVKVRFPIISWIWNVADNNREERLKGFVSKGPVAVSFLALENFSKYKSGIYDDPECTRNGSSATNHAIVIVGYGTDSATGMDYWIIRNSWGKSWGNGGYAKVRRGVNICNIQRSIYQVIVGSESKNNAKIEIKDEWTKDAPANYICDGKNHAGNECKTQYKCEYKAVYQTDMWCHESPENLIWSNSWYRETGDVSRASLYSYTIPKSWETCNDTVLSNMKLPEGKDPKLPSSYSCNGLHGTFFLPGCRRFIACRKQIRKYDQRSYANNFYDEKIDRFVEENDYLYTNGKWKKTRNIKCSGDNVLTYDIIDSK